MHPRSPLIQWARGGKKAAGLLETDLKRSRERQEAEQNANTSENGRRVAPGTTDEERIEQRDEADPRMERERERDRVKGWRTGRI